MKKIYEEFENPIKRRIPIPLRTNRIKDAKKGKGSPYKREKNWKKEVE